eukprot:CAMPEP_0114677946 /NCGR_PEP_ID=MMETSP0191-20121206/51120_1 /TAXON_ID=126664 /ORGANISM="Sorites sp." /LENGTH=73 /DNA_ID=CAMNT_0001951205 /DNA_START=47 /DNA_END=266 /DNA_ORIENTATION=-
MLEVISGAALRVMSQRSVWMVRELVEWVILTVILWVWRPGYMEEYKVFHLADPEEATSSGHDSGTEALAPNDE